MRVGMIFECGREGADQAVCVALAKRIRCNLIISTRTLNDKPALIEACGSAAAQMFTDGCVRVFVIWDLRPAWPEKTARPCLRLERQAILASIRAAGVSREYTHLICIQQELEAWLLSDERALSSVLSRPTHTVTVARRRRVHQIANPKSVLNSLFKRHTGRRYVDRHDALKIVNALPDLNRLRRVDSFRRFETKLTT